LGPTEMRGGEYSRAAFGGMIHQILLAFDMCTVSMSVVGGWA
jgi:hypothetical protein